MIGYLKKRMIKIKYFVSYFILLAIPLLFFVNIYFSNFSIKYEEKIIKNKSNELTLESNLVAEIFNQIDLTVNQLEYNDKFRSIQNPSSEILAIDIINDLKNYKVLNTYIQDIIFYPRKGNILYSTVSTYSVDNYIDQICEYSNWTQEEFMYDIKYCEKQVFRSSEKIIFNGRESEYITILYPLPNFLNMYIYGTIVVQLDKQKIIESFNHGQEDIDTFVLDDNGNMIFSITNNVYKDRGKENQSRAISYSKEDNQYCFYKKMNTLYNEFQFVKVVDKNLVLNEVYTMRNRMYVYLIIVIAMGIILIEIFMKMNYAPLSRFISVVTNNYTEYNQLEHDNINAGFEEIIDTIDNIYNTAEGLKNELAKQMNNYKELLLLKIINKEITNTKEFNENSSITGITFSQRTYAMLIVGEENNLEFKKNEVISNQLTMCSSELMQIFAVYKVNTNRFYIVLSAEENIGLDEVAKQLLKIISKYDYKTLIGASSSYDKFENMYLAAQEADIAIEYAIRQKLNIVAYKDVIGEILKIKKYPQIEMNQLTETIKMKNHDESRLIINDIINDYFNENSNIFYARFLSYKIINVFQYLNHDNEINVLKTSYINNIIIKEAKTLNDLKYAIESTYNIMVNDSKNNTTSLKQQFSYYVNENYHDYDLTIAKLALEFGFSLKTLRRFVKENFNQTPIEYVNHIRIQNSKKLLMETDFKIKEITKKIGYLDESSFIKKFKKNCMMTPGQYRDKYKANNK